MNNQNIRYSVVGPSGRKNYFRIVKYSGEGKDRQYYEFKDPRLEAINKQYRSGIIDRNTATLNLKQMVTGFYLKSADTKMRLRASVLAGENGDILKAYWREKYSQPGLSDEKATLYELERALKFLGNESLRTAPVEDIHKALKKNTQTINQYRRAVEKLNQLLKFIGRPNNLKKPEKEDQLIRYLSLEEVFLLAEQTDDPKLSDAVIGLFGTGCRIGEFLAIRPPALKKGSVLIDKQIVIKDRAVEKGSIKAPKRKKKGIVRVIPECWDAVERWASYDKSEEDYQPIYKFITDASEKLWPRDEIKQISPHDLRHSHAVHIVEKGVPLGLVAKNLRNNIKVTEDYYTGYANTDVTSEQIGAYL